MIATPLTVPMKRRASAISVRLAWRDAVERLGPVITVFFALVVFASGFSAFVLLGWPGSTGTTFSWRLAPEPVAATTGGLYLASAVAFSYALSRTWGEVKGLWVAVYGLSVPTFVATLVHNEVFDFGRWQALAWLAIFTGAPIAVTAALLTKRHERPLTVGTPMAAWVRVLLAVVGSLLAVVGVLALLDPSRRELSEHAPFALVGLSGAYLGAWCAFAAMLAAWSAAVGEWCQARLPVLVLAALPVGALLGLTRTPEGVSPAAVTALLTVTGLAALSLASERLRTPAASALSRRRGSTARR
jgi:hypothetical protein